MSDIDLLLSKTIISPEYGNMLFTVDINSDGAPNFTIGNQTFTLQFDSEIQARSEAEFFARALKTALSNLVREARLETPT